MNILNSVIEVLTKNCLFIDFFVNVAYFFDFLHLAFSFRSITDYSFLRCCFSQNKNYFNSTNAAIFVLLNQKLTDYDFCLQDYI